MTGDLPSQAVCALVGINDALVSAREASHASSEPVIRSQQPGEYRRKGHRAARTEREVSQIWVGLLEVGESVGPDRTGVP